MAIRGRFLFLMRVLLLVQTVVISEDLKKYEEIFKGLGTLEEEKKDEIHGVIGIIDYNSNIWHTWDILPPDHSQTGSKIYTFLFHIARMDIAPGMEIEIDGFHEISNHIDDDYNRCLDFVHINHHKYCGTRGWDETPYTVVVEHVDLVVRVDFRSGDRSSGFGFIASYEWIEE